MNFYLTYESRGCLKSFTLFITVKTPTKLNLESSVKVSHCRFHRGFLKLLTILNREKTCDHAEEGLFRFSSPLWLFWATTTLLLVFFLLLFNWCSSLLGRNHRYWSKDEDYHSSSLAPSSKAILQLYIWKTNAITEDRINTTVYFQEGGSPPILSHPKWRTYITS